MGQVKYVILLLAWGLQRPVEIHLQRLGQWAKELNIPSVLPSVIVHE